MSARAADGDAGTAIMLPPFVPDRFTQLHHTTAWSTLEPAVRRRYNRLYGVRCNEQFMLFESGFTARVVGRIAEHARRRGERELVVRLEGLLADEIRHHRAFDAFNRARMPEVCAAGPVFTALPPRERAALDVAARTPALWPVLLWLVLALEEFSIAFAAMVCAAPGIDPDYAALHAAHARDERRHVHLDAEVLTWLLGRAGRAARRVQAALFRRLLAEVVAPRRSGVAVIRRLCREFPPLAAHEAVMVGEVRALGQDRGVRDLLDDPRRMPTCAALARSHPEFAWGAFRADPSRR
ncbi:MAG: diiron oxygenase [Ectothiorhodospiraceae bacterium]|nr:diiron oxygenase [Ectothiorhodospiraceae bacterium]